MIFFPMMFGWYWLLIVPGIILSIWAQTKVARTYQKYSKIYNRNGITGAHFAQVMLRQNGISGTGIAPVAGNLTDHYDPRKNTVNLSEGVYNKQTITAIAIAAHECGHVIQHAKGYGPIKARTALVPIVNVISSAIFPLIIIGFFMAYTPLVTIAAWAYLGICVFQLVTLPVEFNASKRALQNISASGVLTAEELPGAKEMLNAAALTYVAALLVSLLQFIRLMAISRR